MQKENGKEQLGGAEVRVCGGGSEKNKTNKQTNRKNIGKNPERKEGGKGIAQCRKKDGQDKQQEGDGERAGRT